MDTHCINEAERCSLENDGYHVTESQRWIGYRLKQDLSDTGEVRGSSVESSMINRGCLYFIDDWAVNCYGSYVTGSGSQGESPFIGTVMGGAPDSFYSPIGMYWGSEVVQAFFDGDEVEFESVHARFENISEALTTYVRENGMANFSEAARGVVDLATTCIDVRWEWISYPAILALLTLGFFLLVTGILQPGRVWPAVWKSSPLALLYHGLGEDADQSREADHSGRSGFESIYAMEAVASGTFVRLRTAKDNVALVEVRRKDKAMEEV